jgi:Domain of unknown function (DUF4349)
MKIHDEIDNYLAADLHCDLSDEEQNALHTHLVECADCRKLHQETKVMSKALEEKFANEKPDAAFEQRMLAGFRNRVPQKNGSVAKFIVDLMRLRTIQASAVAALLVALVGIGHWLTNPSYFLGNEELAVSAGPRPGSFADLRQRLVADEIRSDPRFREMLNDSESAVPSAGLRESKAATDQHASATPGAVDTYRKDDVTRLGVLSAPHLLEPAAKAARAKPSLSETQNEPTEMLANRKLIRNATVELEIASFDAVIQKITAFANEERGYVATTSSEKQENGKLKGQIVVKVLPESLDRFLQKLRGLGELKNQTLGTEDITKAYFDTDARLKNARVMEQRLIDMLKKRSDDINDLLQVEKELGRVREQIEQMQGELKFWNSQVQFATVTISLAEKDMEEPAKFLLKERAQLALYSPEVEKVYNDLKALASPKVQITNAQLDRDNTGRVSARVSMLIAPEESDGLISKAKAMGRVENFQVQTERVAQGGEGISENAKTKRDKVALNISISRDEQEQAFQQTTLRIRTSAVDEQAKKLRDLAGKQGGRVRASSFSRDPDGREYANVTLRVPMKNYNALIQSLDSLGKVENVSVQRQDRSGGQIDEANAPADLSIQVYSQGNIVSSDTGLVATLRRTISQSAGAIMWSLRMIGVAIAFLAPWVIALVGIIWLARRIRSRRS